MAGGIAALWLPQVVASATAAKDAGNQTWYLTRAMAFAAYVLLTLSVLLGMLRTIARQAGERVSWAVDELHQVAATLAGLAIVGHLVTLLLDAFLPFTVANLLLPLDEPYRALPVQLGVLALYGMALLLVSSWMRRRVPYRLWRGLHYLSFITFALVTAHGFLAGSDADEPWMRAVYAGAAAAVVFLGLARLFAGPASVPEARDVAQRL